MTKRADKYVNAKLDLRRHMLNEFDVGPRHVLDCFQGNGVLWRNLRNEYEVETYWGVDKEQKAGRMKIDSKSLLSSVGIKANVIDVDSQGSPWGHRQTMLPNLRQPTIVFLTCGHRSKTPIDKIAIEQIGLDNFSQKLPGTILQLLVPFALNWLLSLAFKFCHLMEVFEAATKPSNQTRYLGCFLEPIIQR